VIVNTGSRDEILAMNPDEMGKKSAPEIQHTSSGKIKIARKFIEKSMNNLANIMQDALIKPYFRRGKVEGFKITGSPEQVIANGKITVRNGKWSGEEAKGRFLFRKVEG